MESVRHHSDCTPDYVCNHDVCERNGLDPADHPLLQADPPYWGFTNLTKAQAKAIDAEYLRRI